MSHDPETAKKPAYISYCRKCGGMTGCCADEGKRANDVASFVSEAIRYGQTVERKTAADVWSATWCECDTTNEQPTLFDKQEVQA